MPILFLTKKMIPLRVFSALAPAYHFLLAFLAALFYRFPSRRLCVIGVTGTGGKTMVVEILHGIFEKAGAKTASASSLRFKIGDREERNFLKMTMPGRFFLQKFLRRAVKNGCRYAVLEVTSEGIKQFRHRFVRFYGAAMTNVSPEHIESHGGFERYLRAKLDLFWRLPADGIAVINRDDKLAERFSAATPARKIFYGRGGILTNNKETFVKNLEFGENGVRFDLNGRAVSSSLPGEFNFYNLLAAAAVGMGRHLSLEKIAAGIAGVSGIPGRMEFLQKKPFAVVADYAHTPDSLKKVYGFFKKNCSLICVLGAAGGGRDRWKRPELGRTAAEFCDEIILTNEDPYDENPAEIIEQIARGIERLPDPGFRPTVRKIIDRREAIRAALKTANSGNAVIITGKGAEPWIMGAKGVKIPWDDRKVIKEELKNESAKRF